jgi:hypothetical protein
MSDDSSEKKKRGRPPAPPKEPLPKTASYADFVAYLPERTYVFLPTRHSWSPQAINSILPKIGGNLPAEVLDNTSATHCATWFPGQPTVIKDHLVLDGEFVHDPGKATLNLYKPPRLMGFEGDPTKAGRWVDHVFKLYGDDADHLLNWFASRVQHPEVKINHAVVLGSPMQGIGKDALVTPLRRAVGSWNFGEIGPIAFMDEEHNAYVRKVILRVSEVRDLGNFNRWAFYEHSKSLLVTPPETYPVMDKWIARHDVVNCVGVIFTTNNLTNGLCLPAEDRRHFVCWTDLTNADFSESYWTDLFHWYEHEQGIEHVVAFLHARDLSGFNPKAHPPKTKAFWQIVEASHSDDDSGVRDLIDLLNLIDEGGDPGAFTIDDLLAVADPIKDEKTIAFLKGKNTSAVKSKLSNLGYTSVPNPASKEGRWKIAGRGRVVYYHSQKSPAEREKATRTRVDQLNTAESRKKAKAEKQSFGFPVGGDR